jgi:hypothetical protein
MTQFSKWKTIGYAVALFVAGGISGGALGIYETKSSLFAPPREQEMALRLLHRLQVRLDLSPDQVAKITPIVESAAADLRSIHAETAQRVGKVFDDSYSKVSAILTPEQRVKLDQIQKERREMMQAHWAENHRHPGGADGLGGPGGPGGPGGSSGPGASAP